MKSTAIRSFQAPGSSEQSRWDVRGPPFQLSPLQKHRQNGTLLSHVHGFALRSQTCAPFHITADDSAQSRRPLLMPWEGSWLQSDVCRGKHPELSLIALPVLELISGQGPLAALRAASATSHQMRPVPLTCSEERAMPNQSWILLTGTKCALLGLT